MKKVFKMALGFLFLAAGVLSCTRSELNIYIREGHISTALIEKFAKENNCKITTDSYNVPEDVYKTMTDLARVKKYDVVMSVDEWARKMYEERMAVVFEKDKLPNLDNIPMTAMRGSVDPNMTYSAPNVVTYSGIAYNKNVVKDFKPSWNQFARDDLAGKIGVLMDYRQVVGFALKVNGGSFNDVSGVSIKKAANSLDSWRKNIGMFAPWLKLEAALKSGEMQMVVTFSGSAFNLMKEDGNIGFAIPEEGTAMNRNNFVIPRESTHKNTAYKFINFFMNSDVAREQMMSLHYYCPAIGNQKLTGEEFSAEKGSLIFMDPDIKLRSEFLKDLPEETNNSYLTMWRKFRQQ